MWEFADHQPGVALGIVVVLSILVFISIRSFNDLCSLFYKGWEARLRSRNIAAYGWPPAHCDATGAFHMICVDDEVI